MRRWEGSDTEYRVLHQWVVRQLGKPGRCSKCGDTEWKDKRYYHWANISGEYKRDVTDWVRLCRPCHHSVDGITYFLHKDACKLGHPLVDDNVYVFPKSQTRTCKTCKLANARRYKALLKERQKI